LHGTFRQHRFLNNKEIFILPYTKIRSTSILLSIAFLFSCAFIRLEGQAQDKNRKSSWQAKLYEKDVKYENFACMSEDAQLVATFFMEHPLLSRDLPICHNDCPVIRCRPVIPFPSIARAAKVTGTVSVHVLIDEQGKTLYARVLDGHPLLWAAIRKGACETQFNPHPADHKRQGVMHFNVEDSPFLAVPYTANQVR
jgi:hypothetical protein